MKKTIFISVLIAVFLVITVLPATAQRGDDAKRKSKNGKVEGTIDGVKVVLEYGRPNVKGRTIFGELVPYDKLWRAGADEATTFMVDKDVTIEGKKLAAGTYSLFAIPGKTDWTFVFNTVAKQWGGYKYDKTKDALRVTTKAKAVDLVETLTFKVKEKHVVLCWEKACAGFAVAAAK